MFHRCSVRTDIRSDRGITFQELNIENEPACTRSGSPQITGIPVEIIRCVHPVYEPQCSVLMDASKVSIGETASWPLFIKFSTSRFSMQRILSIMVSAAVLVAFWSMAVAEESVPGSDMMKKAQTQQEKISEQGGKADDTITQADKEKETVKK
jgi:hypothetical protein